MAALDRLGLLPRLLDVGTRIERMDIRSASGAVLATGKMPDLAEGLDHAIAVRRTDLHQLLLDAVTSSERVQTRFGCTVVSADPAGAVIIQAGGDAVTTNLPADLVVGADGVGSVVRETGGFDSRMSAGSTYLRSIVPGWPDPLAQEYWTRLGSFGHAALRDDTTYFWAAADASPVADAVSGRDLASLMEQWRRVLPVAGDLLEKVPSFDDLLVNTVRRVDCRRWFSGHLVLLGDAAHAMAPNLGQGANSALVDAVALAEEVATAPSHTQALARYDQARRLRTRRVQNAAGILQRLCRVDQRIAVRTRDAVLGGLNRIPRLAEAGIRQGLAADIHAVRSASVLVRPSR
jgi:2-polyprenyl-6-methoxyphenol hydroxylase-like FAD-dependent oxidoreductase